MVHCTRSTSKTFNSTKAVLLLVHPVLFHSLWNFLWLKTFGYWVPVNESVSYWRVLKMESSGAKYTNSNQIPTSFSHRTSNATKYKICPIFILYRFLPTWIKLTQRCQFKSNQFLPNSPFLLFPLRRHFSLCFEGKWIQTIQKPLEHWA